MHFADFVYQRELHTKGYKNIAGLDEAGRGPWAGPVTAGCVIIHDETQMVAGVGDSKSLSEKKRELFFEDIKSKSTGWGVGIVSAQQIDEIGIQRSVLLAMTLALEEAHSMINSGDKSFGPVDCILADGNGILTIPGYPMEKIIKGDVKHYCIAAGSILAKVTRDRMMIDYAKEFPQYGFEKHVGYGTKLHMEALALHGPCEIHRKSYKPIQKIVNRG